MQLTYKALSNFLKEEYPYSCNNQSPPKLFLTHWGRDMMAAIFLTFSNTFSWMKTNEFWIRFHWRLFSWIQLIIFHDWFRQWLGADQATSHYLNQWWFRLLTHICVTRSQWVKRQQVPLWQDAWQMPAIQVDRICQYKSWGEILKTGKTSCAYKWGHYTPTHILMSQSKINLILLLSFLRYKFYNY